MTDTETKLSADTLIERMGKEARKAAALLGRTDTDQINSALDKLADMLVARQDEILSANDKDVTAAKEKGLSASLIDRLTLTIDRIKSMGDGVKVVRALDDPTGHVLWSNERPNGLKISRVSVPIGVLGMIYEARPNVTIDASILCLKSHNAVILRGGSESLHSSLALHKIIQAALNEAGLPSSCAQMIPTGDREAVGAMLRADRYIDVMIPRGGAGLIKRVQDEARMPVFSHLQGICHLYVHPSAKHDLAVAVCLNAKMRRTGVCGAAETILLDKNLDKNIATDIVTALLDAGCAVVGDTYVHSLDERIGVAHEEDWFTEYLDAKISIKQVDSVEGAVDHINHYGSHHTDSILAEDQSAVNYFLKNVDSGIVMHNASTQFADGGEFGMGAEIGIATGKMHARGPVGLEQLCTYKYHVRGSGQTRP